MGVFRDSRVKAKIMGIDTRNCASCNFEFFDLRPQLVAHLCKNNYELKYPKFINFDYEIFRVAFEGKRCKDAHCAMNVSYINFEYFTYFSS